MKSLSWLLVSTFALHAATEGLVKKLEVVALTDAEVAKLRRAPDEPSMDEDALTPAEVDALTSFAADILTGQKFAFEVMLEGRLTLSPAVLEAVEEVGEMYDLGHWTAWCGRHGADPSTAPDEVGIPGARLAPLCARLPTDAPAAHDPAGLSGPVEKAASASDEAVIVPLAYVVFGGNSSSRAAAEAAVRGANELFAGMLWRAGTPRSLTRPRDGARPEARFRFYISSFRIVNDDASARECHFTGGGSHPLNIDYDAAYGLDEDAVINVYGCAIPEGFGGYASFGGSVNIELQYLSDEGTLAHELGHSLGLHHTFEGGCASEEGDEVADTPRMEATHSVCPELYEEKTAEYRTRYPWLSAAEIAGYLNWYRERLDSTRDSCPSSMGLDSVYNVMSYTLCRMGFSQQQASRMHAVSEGTGAVRHHARPEIMRPSAARQRWIATGAGKCGATPSGAVRFPVPRGDALWERCHWVDCAAYAGWCQQNCAGFDRGAYYSLDKCIAAAEARGASALSTDSSTGECALYAPAAPCATTAGMAAGLGNGSRWVTYHVRPDGPERVLGWVHGVGARATLALAKSTLAAGEALSVSVVDDPFLDADDNWLGIFRAGDDPLVARPVGGAVNMSMPQVRTLPSARRAGSPTEPLRRTVQLSAPTAAGAYVVRYFCCNGYYTLLGADAQRAAAFTVTASAPHAGAAPHASPPPPPPPAECYHDARGADYRGRADKTASGKSCLPWPANYAQQYASAGVGAHAFCRNPDADRAPWCLTAASGEYGYCAISQCAPNAARAERLAAAAGTAPRGAPSAAGLTLALVSAAALLVAARPLARAARRARDGDARATPREPPSTRML